MRKSSRLHLIWNLPRLLKTSWALIRNPRVAGQRKTILFLVGLGYIIFPFDLIMDVFPLLGQVDDIGVIFLLLNWFINKTEASDDLETDYYFTDEPKEKNK